MDEELEAGGSAEQPRPRGKGANNACTIKATKVDEWVQTLRAPTSQSSPRRTITMLTPRMQVPMKKWATKSRTSPRTNLVWTKAASPTLSKRASGLQSTEKQKTRITLTYKMSTSQWQMQTSTSRMLQTHRKTSYKIVKWKLLSRSQPQLRHKKTLKSKTSKMIKKSKTIVKTNLQSIIQVNVSFHLRFKTVQAFPKRFS